jgi:RNA polymerase sigma-70 factor, ECF subfamily
VSADSDAHFIAFVHARSAALLRLAVLLTGDRQDGEDLLQIALTKAYRSWWRLRKPELAEAYVRRILVTSVTSWRRRGAARERPSDLVPDQVVAGAGAGADAEVADRVVLAQALRMLSPGQRAVLVLRFFDDLSEQQTADLLGCSVGTVKSQTSRGLAALRRRIGAIETDDRMVDDR